MARIEEIKSGSLAKSKKLNEVIRYLNSLLNAKVREGSSTESPKLVAGEGSTEIITTGGSELPDDGGSGLPEYPGTIPNVPDFKGILAWSVAENEALWLQGDPDLEDGESNPLPQVMFYDPTSRIQNFSLIGMQLLDVVICKDGEPVEGQIFFKESPE